MKHFVWIASSIFLVAGCLSLDMHEPESGQAYAFARATGGSDNFYLVLKGPGGLLEVPFQDNPDSVRIIPLPEGTYTIDSVKLSLASQARFLKPDASGRKLAGATFKAMPGEAVYLGDYRGFYGSSQSGGYVHTSIELESTGYNLDEAARELVAINPAFNGYTFRELDK